MKHCSLPHPCFLKPKQSLPVTVRLDLIDATYMCAHTHTHCMLCTMCDLSGFFFISHRKQTLLQTKIKLILFLQRFLDASALTTVCFHKQNLTQIQ